MLPTVVAVLATPEGADVHGIWKTGAHNSGSGCVVHEGGAPAQFAGTKLVKSFSRSKFPTEVNCLLKNKRVKCADLIKCAEKCAVTQRTFSPYLSPYI